MSPGLAPTTKLHQITTRPRGCTRLPFDEAPNARSTDTLEVVCLEGGLTIEIASYLTKKRGTLRRILSDKEVQGKWKGCDHESGSLSRLIEQARSGSQNPVSFRINFC